jgi:hypothetical protein
LLKLPQKGIVLKISTGATGGIVDFRMSCFYKGKTNYNNIYKLKILI